MSIGMLVSQFLNPWEDAILGIVSNMVFHPSYISYWIPSDCWFAFKGGTTT